MNGEEIFTKHPRLMDCVHPRAADQVYHHHHHHHQVIENDHSFFFSFLLVEIFNFLFAFRRI